MRGGANRISLCAAMNLRTLALGLVSSALFLSACGASSDVALGNDPAVRREAVGALNGTDGRVGIVLQYGKVNFFSCGGPATYASHTKWLRGDAPDYDRFSLAADGWSVTAERVAGHWSGKLRRPTDTADLTFDAYYVDPYTSAGLYESTQPEGLAGVVVFQRTKSDPATALGSFKLVGGGFAQVLPVRTAREAAGLLVEVPFASGARQFYVQQSLVAR